MVDIFEDFFNDDDIEDKPAPKPLPKPKEKREKQSDSKQEPKADDPEVKRMKEDAKRDSKVSKYFIRGQFNVKVMVADVLCEFKHIWNHNDALHIYNPEVGLYKPDVLGDIELFIRQKLMHVERNMLVNETIRSLKSYATHEPPERQDFLIPFSNGIIDLKNAIDNGKFDLQKHSPDNYLLKGYSVSWDANANSDVFSDWTAELVGSDDFKVLHEMIGSIFDPKSSDMQSSFLLIGDGSNGKSLFLDIITKVIGMENVCSIEWADYGNNTFATAELHKKALAVDTDIQNDKPISSAVKKAITGDVLKGQFKYKHPFDVDIHATWIGAANELPKSKDQTFGFFRRWIPVEFPNTFPKDMKFARQLKIDSLTEESKSSIVKFALAMYVDAIKNGGFTVSDNSLQLNDKLQKIANNVKAWTDSECILEQDSFVGKISAYTSYSNWMANDKTLGKAVGNRAFYQALRDIGCIVERKDRESINGNRQEVIRGIVIKGY